MYLFNSFCKYIIGRVLTYIKSGLKYKKKSYSSFLFSIDKKIGSIINRKITKQPVIIDIEVFNFIVVK